MALTKRGRIWWLDYYDEHGRRRRESTRVRSRRAAEIIEGKALAAVELRRAGLAVADPVAGARPLAEWIARYAEHVARDHSAQHAAKARQVLTRAAAEQGWLRPAHLNAETITRHLEALVGGRASARYHNRVLGHLVKFCDYLAAHTPPAVGHNPARQVARRPEPQSDARGWLEEHEIALLRTARRPPNARAARWEAYRLFWDMAIEVGLRAGEIRGVKAGHLHLDGANPFVELPAANTKSGRWEAVPASDFIAERLRAWAHGLAPAAELFRVPYAGSSVVIKPPPVALLHRVLELVGVSPVDHDGRTIDNHGLRYTFGHRLVRAGVPQPQLQRLMRHSDPNTTAKIYTRAGRLEPFEAMRRLNEYARRQA